LFEKYLVVETVTTWTKSAAADHRKARVEEGFVVA
jgi:hypothetical protein